MWLRKRRQQMKYVGRNVDRHRRKMKLKKAMAINFYQMCVRIDFMSLSEMKTNERTIEIIIITVQAQKKKNRSQSRNIERTNIEQSKYFRCGDDTPFHVPKPNHFHVCPLRKMSNVMMINVLTLSTQASTIELYCGNFALNIGHLLSGDDDLILSSMQNKYTLGWIFAENPCSIHTMKKKKIIESEQK